MARKILIFLGGRSLHVCECLLECLRHPQAALQEWSLWAERRAAIGSSHYTSALWATAGNDAHSNFYTRGGFQTLCRKKVHFLFFWVETENL